MRNTTTLLLLLCLLSACATRKPPPEPTGSFRAINGSEQNGMTRPFEQPKPCPANPKLLIC